MYYCFNNSSSKRSLFLVLFWTLVSIGAGAQDQPQIDSLKKLIDATKGAEKADAMVKLAIQFAGSSPNEAIRLAEEAYTFALTTGDSAKIVYAGRISGELLRRADRTDDAQKILSYLLPISRRNKLEADVKFILNSLAVTYTYKAEYDKALDYHFQSLVIREREGDKIPISVTLNNIGLVYFKLKNYEKAIEYYIRALDLKKEIGDEGDLDRLYINVGLCYNQLKNFEQARVYINQALEICNSDGKECAKSTLTEGKFGLGLSYFTEGEVKNDSTYMETSIAYFSESFENARSNDDKRFELENLLSLGKVYNRLNMMDSARSKLAQGEVLARNTEYNQILIDIYKEFSKVYNKREDFENAAHYQDKYIRLNDSLFSEQLIKNIARVQTAFEERENIKTIALKEVALKQQRDLNISIAVIAILASLLILVLQRSNRTIKKVNAALSEAKEVIEDQNKKLQLLNTDLDKEVKVKTTDLEKANHSLHRVVDELDNFIYKTSHDIRGPLASLKGICNIALLDVKDELALKYLNKLDITAEKLNTILTRLLIVNQINNSTLKTDERIDFESVVSDVLLLEKKKGLPPRLQVRKMIDKDISFYSDKEFIRIILENLIDNAIKFYNDSDRIEPFVDITITRDRNTLLIRVVDNGIGISEIHPDKIFQMFSRASERSETGGIGLFITKTATEKLGGVVGLKTTPEGNTEFFLRFSLDGETHQVLNTTNPMT